MARKRSKDDTAEIPSPGRWRRRPALSEPVYAGLGERVKKILQLAESEARDLREEAQRAAAEIIRQAEQDAVGYEVLCRTHHRERRASASPAA